MDHFSSLVLKRTKSWIQDLFASTAFEGRRIWFVILVTIFDLATFCVHAVKHSTLTTHHQFYSSMCAKCGSIACSMAVSPFQVLTFMHTWSVRAVYFIFQLGHMCAIHSLNIANCPVSQAGFILQTLNLSALAVNDLFFSTFSYIFQHNCQRVVIWIIVAVGLDFCFQLCHRYAQMSLVDDTWEDGDYAERMEIMAMDSLQQWTKY